MPDDRTKNSLQQPSGRQPHAKKLSEHYRELAVRTLEELLRTVEQRRLTGRFSVSIDAKDGVFICPFEKIDRKLAES